MAHTVEILPAAQRQLGKLAKKNPRDTRAIFEAIFDLEHDPLPVGVEPIQGVNGLYRIRVGNFRVVYGLENQVLKVGVVRVGDRKDVYAADPKTLQRAFEAWQGAQMPSKGKRKP
ncbi:MAG: type II toxin-antitoxin system RelE family toxin [Candidatus Sericytochromatia bacterium]